MPYDEAGATFPGGPGEVPRVTSWNTVASYATYAEAHAAVDRLAVAGFPVQEIEIVGSDLRVARHEHGTTLR